MREGLQKFADVGTFSHLMGPGEGRKGEVWVREILYWGGAVCMRIGQPCLVNGRERYEKCGEMGAAGSFRVVGSCGGGRQDGRFIILAGGKA